MMVAPESWTYGSWPAVARWYLPPRAHQREDRRLLGVHAVAGLLPDDRAAAVDHQLGDLLPTPRGQAVHEDVVATGKRHQLRVHVEVM